MSVTFTPAAYVECDPELAKLVGAPTVLSSVAEDVAPVAGVETDVVELLKLNVHETGGSELLRALGYEVDPEYGPSAGGHDAGEAFLGRLLIALAIAPEDEGMEAYKLQPGEGAGVLGILSGGGATVWIGPRAPGYLQDRLASLRPIAEFAAAHGLMMAWG